MDEAPVVLRRIDLFPLKSLPGLSVSSATLMPDGPLEYDRRWALFDAEGHIVNGKRHPGLHCLDLQFASDLRSLRLGRHDAPADGPEPLQICWPEEHSLLAEYVSEVLQFPVQIREDSRLGFPDDTLASGPTIIGTATLHEVTRWFPGLGFEECCRRFRANLLLETTVPFWEDRLFGSPNRPRKFWLGEVPMWGINPCQRCAVPSRDSRSGAVLTGFQKQFAERRQATFPSEISAAHFNHYYRLAVNTRLDNQRTGQVLRVGDRVRLDD
ncbi:MAG: MOSC N-terminal beta barrel domain-containing protein [Planctomycetaceae bacterium]|nr:MOSC N-terminal beta barrel domain-containing protein [Planctomycetaceae bacterium]